MSDGAGDPSSTSEQALAGLRVLEFSAGMAGPWIGRFMAWAGAEVIKVESKGHPDVTRLYVPPRDAQSGIQPELSPWFTDWNAGKRFIALDLRRPDATALCKRLAARCDVVVENYSAGVLDKLGLGYAQLRQVKPDLIMFSSSGYGDSGPLRRYVTWGPNIEALAGLSSVSGFPGRDCTMTQYAYPDALSAVHGLFAVLCALDYRGRTGAGQYINLAQLEATIAVFGHVMMETLAGGSEPYKLGNRSHVAAPQGCYPCRGEDRWCVVTIDGERSWRALCELMGAPELVADPRFATPVQRRAHAEALDELIATWTRERDAHEVMNALQQAGIAAGVVQTVEDMYRRDPQLGTRGFFEEIPHHKKGRVIANGIPLGLTATPGRTTSSGCSVGHDTGYVFEELLGLTAEQVRHYIDSGVIQTAD